MKREDVLNVTRDELIRLVYEAKFVQKLKIDEQEAGTLKALAAAFGEKPGK